MFKIKKIQSRLSVWMFSLHFYDISQLTWLRLLVGFCSKRKRVPSLRWSAKNTFVFRTNLKGYEYISTELCKCNMNIMGIRIFTKFPKGMNTYNLRAKTELKTNLYWVLISTLKQTHSEILLTVSPQFILRFHLGDAVGQTFHKWKIVFM